MKKVISVLLIIGGLYLGYEGVTRLQNSSSSVGIGDVQLSIKDESSAASAYIYLGLGVLMIAGGVVMLRKAT